MGHTFMRLGDAARSEKAGVLARIVVFAVGCGACVALILWLAIGGFE